MTWTLSKGSRRGKQAMLLGALRSTFALLDPLAPGLAARLALRLFLTPPGKPRVSAEEQACLRRATRLDVPAHGGVPAYSWGEGPAVLLVHGWGGRGSQMCAFVAPLVEAGFRVVSFDGPAHGDSPGARTDMIAFAAAIRAVVARLGGVEAIIGHSFGAACSLLALRDQKRLPKKLVLIGCPPNAIWVTEQFGAVLGMQPATLARMRALLVQRHRGALDWEDLSMVKMARASRVPVLLMHDRDDRTIPYEKAAVPFLSEGRSEGLTIEHLATQGFGHRGILKAAPAIGRTLRFLSGPSEVALPLAGAAAQV
jgi:pimeloyl-ACP methyl ester carboxylesterase